MKILYCEDDLDLASIVKELLEERDHEVVHFENGKEAFDWMLLTLGQGIELLITDRDMPLMTGEVLVTNLREHNHSFPVIVTSGSWKATKDYFTNCYFVPKPINFDWLFKLLEHL